MQAMQFEQHLHWSFRDEHVLFSFIELHSLWGFLGACTAVIIICVSERFLTFTLDRQWAPYSFKLSRRRLALWRTGLYSMVTFLRLCYMLVAMSFHLGLVLMIVVTLSIAQFFIELQSLPKPLLLSSRNMHDRSLHEPASQPLLPQSQQQHPLHHIKTRPRSKSKPDDIFIHPAESNIARADAVALELGLAGDTDRVQGYSYTKDEPAWEIGRGKDLAREMLQGSNKKAPVNQQPHHEPFYINDDSDHDSDSE